MTLSKIRALYISYVNDFISINAFAAAHDLTIAEAETIIARGRVICLSDGTLSRDHFLNNNPQVIRERFPTMSKNNITYFMRRHEEYLLSEHSA